MPSKSRRKQTQSVALLSASERAAYVARVELCCIADEQGARSSTQKEQAQWLTSAALRLEVRRSQAVRHASTSDEVWKPTKSQ